MIVSDLIISDSGDVVFVQNAPFKHEVTRVEFYIETGYLMLIDAHEDSRLIAHEITDEEAIDAIIHASTILLTYILEDEPQDGFEVPLITVGR